MFASNSFDSLNNNSILIVDVVFKIVTLGLDIFSDLIEFHIKFDKSFPYLKPKVSMLFNNSFSV